MSIETDEELAGLPILEVSTEMEQYQLVANFSPIDNAIMAAVLAEGCGGSRIGICGGGVVIPIKTQPAVTLVLQC